MKNRNLSFYQDEGPIHLPSVFVINGVRMHRLPLKRGPKPKAEGGFRGKA